MAQTIGVKLALEGEKTFKAELKAIQQQSKELAAEMKAVVTAGEGEEKMMSVLGRQIQNSQKLIDTLTQKYDKQKQGIEETKKALADAEKEYGENSVEVQKLKTELANQETQLSKTKTEINKETAELSKLEQQESATADDVEDLGEETEDAGKKAEKGGDGFTVFKGVLADLAASAIKSALAGIKQLGSAFIDLTKQAISGYADMEQLEGGVEKLFGDDATTVIQNASSAFKTAGLSANEYMETVTGVSASLISSLGGDTAKAAEMADMTISDMADNANVFGTSMEDVQNVYSSLSKGQYQTLDNLKLGFAGSKTGMQELMQEAENLDSSFVAQRDEAGNLTMEYSDMVQAIHIVQENMNITGTTAKEASKTISGSINATKSAWKNLLAGLGDPNADVKTLANNVIESATDVVNNVIPIVENIVEAIPVALDAIIGAIESNNLIGTVIEAAGKIVSALVKSLPTMLNQIFTTISQLLPTLMQTISQALPLVIQMIIQLVVDLCSHLSEILEPIIAMLPSMITMILDALSSNIGAIIAGIITCVIMILDHLPEIIQALIEGIPVVIVELIKAIVQNLPRLILAIIQCVGQIAVSIWNALKNLWNEYVKPWLADVLSKIGQWFVGLITSIGQWFANIFKTIANFFVNIWNTVVSWLANLISKVVSFISSVVSKVVGFVSTVISKIASFFSNIWSSITSWFSRIISKVGELVRNIPNKIREGISKVTEVGKNLVQGLWNGISNAAGWVLDKIKGFGQTILNGIKSIFGINSPSKEMAWVGEMLGAGLAKGIEDSSSEAVQATKNMVDDINNAIGLTDNMAVTGSHTVVNTYDSGVNTLVDLLSEYLPGLSHIDLYLDTGELVGGTVSSMNDALGKLAVTTARGFA